MGSTLSSVCWQYIKCSGCWQYVKCSVSWQYINLKECLWAAYEVVSVGIKLNVVAVGSTLSSVCGQYIK